MNDERKAVADRVMESYGMDKRDPACRDAAEVIAAKSMEARENMRREETRRYY